ncbi:hypothetical protein [Mycobacterium sp. URHD0025]|uniref:hypothetical protein n=1 Tax=Mycobacterium sp. URHD0025 TaxID=1298864 RepID=UPI001E40E492|nr:hypothetical protein [Mycobacterium sp. URHD0025]
MVICSEMNRNSIPCADVVTLDSIVRGLRSRFPSHTGKPIVGIISHFMALGTPCVANLARTKNFYSASSTHSGGKTGHSGGGAHQGFSESLPIYFESTEQC